MVENASITIIKDEKLMIKAGGYDYNSAYKDLSTYAKLGL